MSARISTERLKSFIRCVMSHSERELVDDLLSARARIVELEARQVTVTRDTTIRALRAFCKAKARCSVLGDLRFACREGCKAAFSDSEIDWMYSALTAALAVAGTGDGGSANGAIQMDEVKLVDTHPLYTGNLRYQMLEWTEAEHAIHNAMYAVERAGGSLHLTNAIRLLSQARQAVAQHVLSLPPAPSKGGKS